MSSAEEVKNKALEYVDESLEQLREKSTELNSKELHSEYKKMADELEDKLSVDLDEKDIRGYLRTSVSDEIFDKFRKRYFKIREKKKS